MTEAGRFWDDFTPGERYPTSTRKITEADLDNFCALVGYDVPLFVDSDKAAAGEFGGRICPRLYEPHNMIFIVSAGGPVESKV